VIWLRRVFMCWWGGCGGTTEGDKTHVWCRCRTCGQERNKISHEALRRIHTVREFLAERER
jgi:hypothetical protein